MKDNPKQVTVREARGGNRLYREQKASISLEGYEKILYP